MIKQLYETCDDHMRAVLEQCLITRVPPLEDAPGLVINSPSPRVSEKVMGYAVELSLILEAYSGSTDVAVVDEEGLHRFNSTEVYVWWRANPQ
ncbi:hypothetical protein [Leptolyngbya sp. FACHB-261]|uniref:hypothetical protein n=1 Tax=Leptolyngbya sp. FACHB-261 TaxID=2692806 RepID=UPI0016880A52|nr:hypothetical protein [Leptolyngbya sp. FACHB-261]MBD2099851.1 hypothetical protein [Leptolyngbya sp. FACHB-261]